MFRIQTDQGCTLDVRLVRKGERWGREDCLVHDKPDPLVEFYALSEKHKHIDPRGFLVSRYYASTLLQRQPGGLSLDGRAPQYDVDAAADALVHGWLQSQVSLSVLDDADGFLVDRTPENEIPRTTLAAFLADNAEDAETCRKVRTLPIGESVDLGGGACPVVRVTNLGFVEKV